MNNDHATKPPSLSEVAYFARQSVKFTAIALVILMISRSFWGAFSNYWRATHPAPPPPPTVGFGILPPLIFPDQDKQAKPKNYRLETPNGRLPELPDQAPVLLMVKTAPSLLDDERAKAVAAKLGFVFAPEVINSQKYLFNKNEPLSATLEINPVSLHFKLESDFLSRPELLTNRAPLDQKEGAAIVKSLLKSADLLTADLATSSGETLYLKAAGNSLQPALSFSDADYLAVVLPRQPILGTYPTFTADGEAGPIKAILTGYFNGIDQIVKMNYNLQQIDYSHQETYPLRSVKQAWQLLQAGEAYVARPIQSDTAIIRRIGLAYYESPQEQDYFQPIYVFSGDEGFLAFVSAVDGKYIQQ